MKLATTQFILIFSTAVLSSNCFKSISVEKLPKLTKLSLSQNSLRNIPDVQVGW